MNKVKRAAETSKIAEAVWKCMNDVKTSFKKDHIIDLASHENDACSMHIKTVITKRKISLFREKIRKFVYVINRFEIQ